MFRTIALCATTILALIVCPIGGVRAGVPTDLELEFVTGGLTRPVTIRHAGDGSGRLFIVEQAGRIRIYDTNAGTLLPTPFLDIVALVDDSGNEQGLLGLDFHPNFETNGYFYVNYTRDPPTGLDRTVIARYEVSANPDVAEPASAFTLLEIAQDFSNHNGGDIHFGPDGYLYIGMGDGGSGNDPNNRAQNLGQLLGKMLRIDVDGSAPAEPNDLCGLIKNYGIPADNPFQGGSGDCDEIWAFGVRNPWRWSFDRITDDLVIGDVGQNAIEEVDFQKAASSGGENYGWSCMEGNNATSNPACLPGGLVAPIFTYTHSFGCSITGGYVYRGPISALDGSYVVADYCSGRIWFGDETSPNVWTFNQWMDTTMSISSFGEDEVGNVYVADFNSGIYRFSVPITVGGSRVPDGSVVGEEPLRVRRSGIAGVALTWDAGCAATDTDYEIYDGTIGGSFENHKPRLCSTGGATDAVISAGLGSRYFLVVPKGDGAEGSYGLRSDGAERPRGANPCEEQLVEECP
jgi:glucose/arabinose dehydrogenase